MVVLVKEFLSLHSIDYICHEHPAVYTCEQAEKFHDLMPGIVGKNLFLVDKKSGRIFLVVLPATKKADLKFLTKEFGVAKLSFGSPDLLMEKM